MRLIDANGSYTINANDNTGYNLCFGGGIISVFDNKGHCLCEFDAEDAPTVDAVEVVHAHWDNNGICTLCGYPIPTDSKYDFIDKDDCLFCYHCGAKMYGGNENGVDD